MLQWLRRKCPRAAIRIERKAFGDRRPTTHVVDTLDNIEQLIRHMEQEPQHFIDLHFEENTYFEKKNIRFSVARLMDEFIEDNDGQIPVLAVAKYDYLYKRNGTTIISPVFVGAIIAVILMIFGIRMCGIVADKGNEMLEAANTPCTLFVKGEVPQYILIMGERLTYDYNHRISDPIWEGIATYDMLQMAYHPIERGCEVIDLEKGDSK